LSVRNALLGLLAQRPRHGYELRAAFEALAGGEDVWEVKPAQIYSTLARLEEAGFVKQKGVDQGGGPEKRVYGLTADGKRELGHWFITGIEGEHEHDEFFIKLMLSIASPGIDPYKVIQAQRSKIFQQLHDKTVSRNQANPRTELARIFLLDKVIMHLEADLKWLDLIEARLDEISKQPMPAPEAKGRGRPRKVD
jgi:DNA-binding PadR family transcriptional regulator